MVMHKTFLISVLSSFALYGCNIGKDDESFAYGSNNNPTTQDTDTTQDTGSTEDTGGIEDPIDTGDTAVPEPSGEETEDSLGDENFDNVGDVVLKTDEDGDSIIEIDLSDVSGENNQEQEFYFQYELYNH